MGLMLDSSVFIWAERRRLGASALTEEVRSRFGDTDIAISVITAGELLHGVWRADSPARRAMREQFVEAVISDVPVVPISIGAIRVFAELDARAEASGDLIPVEDLLIASSALYRNDAVVTGNVKDFQRVPGLGMHHWA